MAGKAEVRGRRPDTGVEIIDIRRPRLPEWQPVAGKPHRSKHLLQKIQRAALSGRDAWAAD